MHVCVQLFTENNCLVFIHTFHIYINMCMTDLVITRDNTIFINVTF